MKTKTATTLKLLFTIYWSLFTIHCLFAEILVDVMVPAGITLETISKKYLKDPGLIDKIYEYNKDLPKDKKQPIKTKELKIPKSFLKDKVGDVTFLSPLAKTRKQNETFWKDLSEEEYQNIVDDILRIIMKQFRKKMGRRIASMVKSMDW